MRCDATQDSASVDQNVLKIGHRFGGHHIYAFGTVGRIPDACQSQSATPSLSIEWKAASLAQFIQVEFADNFRMAGKGQHTDTVGLAEEQEVTLHSSQDAECGTLHVFLYF